MFKKILISSLILSFTFFTIGCGKVSKFLPNKVLEEYFDAQKKKDWGKVYDLLSEEFKAQMGNLINSPQGERELRALKAKNPKLKTDTIRDKFIVFLDSQDKNLGEFIEYKILDVPKVEKGKAEITAKVSTTRKIRGKEVKKINNIILKLEKDGWKIKGQKK